MVNNIIEERKESLCVLNQKVKKMNERIKVCVRVCVITISYYY